MTDHTTSAVRMTIDVAVGVERAFEVFTTQFDRIKPREHNMLGEDIAETVLEPKVGGQVYDRGVNGAVCAWGRVLAFDPPDRLVFSWDISPQWQVETDHDRSSEVEVTFTAIDDGRTQVALEHRHLDRHGTGWEGMVPGLEGDQGWPLYLQRFAEIATATS